MRVPGLLLLVAGWIIAISAVALLPRFSLRLGFVVAGLAIEALGLVLVFRSHLTYEETR